MRSKRYQIRIEPHHLPEAELVDRARDESPESWGKRLPEAGEIPNFLPESNAPRPRHQRGAPRLAYHFEDTAPPEFFDPLAGSSKQYRNPIALAQEWQAMLRAGERASRADLARQLGVTQVLGLLDLAPEVVEIVLGLGDPLSTPVVTERSLRPHLKLPVEEQGRALAAISELQGSC